MTKDLDVAGLLERLRATRPSHYVGVFGYGGPTHVLMNADGPAAADTIERLLAEIEQLKGDRHD